MVPGAAAALYCSRCRCCPALYATYVLDGLLPNVVTANETVDLAIAWGETALLIVFALLTCWLAAGFWTAMLGFFVLAIGGDRQLISRSAKAAVISPQARTAIVMPICNEDVRRVFAGLRATYESVMRANALEHFDFFVLSDTANPDACVAELDAWNALREELGAESRLFYRHRRRRVKRKSGNIDDFCRRWGAKYRYMVVLDADSVMTGECLTTLVRLMEARPDAGIIQTAPRAVGRDTLHARMQQFANQVYGPVFTAGLHYWQLGESHYWGHNAIIRLEPFMKHCVLAPLPGRGSLAGEILSHDFVEAALMRRAGYGVWIAYDLDGSFEETPPNLIDEVKRDRRWCHGNLMNARLMFARGMHPVHRWVFLTGALAYLSAPLWLGFLALSTWLLLAHTNAEPQYFVMPHQLFPLWPSWRPEHAWALLAAIASVLFVPKILAALLAAARSASSYGGTFRLAFSVLAEMLMSALLAPVRMLFHTQFVAAALLGWSIQWKSPARADKSTSITQALRRHGLQTVIGFAWVGLVAWKAPNVLPWIGLVAAGLLLSIPISVLTSSAQVRIVHAQGQAIHDTRRDTPAEGSRRHCAIRTQREIAAALRGCGDRSRGARSGSKLSASVAIGARCWRARAARRPCDSIRTRGAECRGARRNVARRRCTRPDAPRCASRSYSFVLVCEFCVGAPRDHSCFWTLVRYSTSDSSDDGARALANYARAQP